jgi:hypothetical protein
VTPRHSLAEKDTQARTALCSVCGSVGIYPAGRGWVCLNKKKASAAAWAQANPEKAHASRTTRSAHRLISRKDTAGECAVCGPVEAVPYGRGWACGKRAAELRKTQQAHPARRCVDCNMWIDSRGTAARCAGCAELNTPGSTWLRTARNGRGVFRDKELVADFIFENAWEKWLRRDLERPLENTKPLVKVLGSGEPVPAEWAWALNPKADWTAFDQEGSKGNERNESMIRDFVSDISGQGWDRTAAPRTLPDHYAKYRAPHESFADFKSRFLAALDDHAVDETTLANLMDFHDDDEYYDIP